MGDDRKELEASQEAPRSTEGLLQETLKTAETSAQAEELLQRRMRADVQGAGDQITALDQAVKDLPPEEQAVAQAATAEAQKAIQETSAEDAPVPSVAPLEMVTGSAVGGIKLSGIENKPYGARRYRKEKVSDIERAREREHELETHQEQADYWKSLQSGFPKDSPQEAFCQAGIKYEEATKELREAEHDAGRVDGIIADIEKTEAITKKELEGEASLSNQNVTAEQRTELYDLLEQLSAEKARLKQEREEVKENAEQARLVFDKAEVVLGEAVEVDEENRAKIAEEMEEDRKTIENLDPKRGSPEEQAMNLANVEYLKAKSGLYKLSQEMRGLNLEEQGILLKLKWLSANEKGQDASTPQQLKKQLKEIQDKRQELEPQLVAAKKLLEEKKGPRDLAEKALQKKKMEGVMANAGRSVGAIKPGGAATGGTREGVTASTQKTFTQTLKGIPGMGKIIEAFKPIISLFGGGGSA